MKQARAFADSQGDQMVTIWVSNTFPYSGSLIGGNIDLDRANNNRIFGRSGPTTTIQRTRITGSAAFSNRQRTDSHTLPLWPRPWLQFAGGR